MKIRLGTLRSLIREAVHEKNGAMFGTREELDRSISDMDAETVADYDYVDSDTGEIYLERGKPAKSSSLHPQYGIDKQAARDAKTLADDARDQADEDDWYASQEDEKSAALAEYDQALDQWKEQCQGAARDLAFENPEFDAQTVASDMADGFFHQFPNWHKWARLLKLNHRDFKDLIVSDTFEAMG